MSPASDLASAMKAAGEVIDEALGIKSPSKKSTKKAVATSNGPPAGAADGGGDGAGGHGAAGGVVPQRPEQMVSAESLNKARRLIFSKDFPSTAPTKTSKQELWEVISVLRTFSQEGQALTETDPPKATDSSSAAVAAAAPAAAVAAAAQGGADSGDSAGTAEDAASGGADVGGAGAGAAGAGAAGAGAGAAGAGAAGAGAGAAGAVADNSPSATHPSATEANGGSTAATANTDVDSSADRTGSDWQTARSKKKICRGFRAGWGCSRPDTCKLFHPTVCNGPCRRAGGKQVEGCTGWHLWTQWGLAKPQAKGKAKPNASGSPAQSKIAQENLNTGSSKAKTAPKLQPANTNSTTSMSKRMREMEIELATMRGAQSERRSSQGRQLPPMPLSPPPGSQLPPQAQQLPWAEPAPSDPAQRSMFSVLQEILSRLDVLEAGPRRH